ncbi:Box C/D snoRNA accumulation [Didymella pomorum]
MKKSELATPAGIDHDYNFLSGIERDLEKADKSVAEKGLDVGLNARPKGDQSQRMDWQFSAAGVKVIRAPKGMSRSKENKTHRSKSGSAAEPLYRIHPLFESPTSKKKRKREAETASNSNPGSLQGKAESSVAQVPSSGIEVNPEVPKTVPSALETQATSQQDAASVDPPTTQPDAAESEAPTEDRYIFFLLRPRTSASRRVLIPLTSTDTLGDALRGQTVEEFPTVYYFPAATPDLSSEYMLDEEYRKEEGEQQREFEELMRDVDPEILRRLKDDGTKSRGDEEVDSKRILDVLKQDLGGL